MAFRTQRGRPKAVRLKTDRGTPELQAQRQQHATTELLDYWLQTDIITEEEHWAGYRFRYLFTLLFGLTHATALILAEERPTAREHHEDWLRDREAEYRAVLALLQEKGLATLTRTACVEGMPPTRIPPRWQEEMVRGLGELARFWKGETRNTRSPLDRRRTAKHEG
jgi:hypothetical protein